MVVKAGKTAEKAVEKELERQQEEEISLLVEKDLHSSIKTNEGRSVLILVGVLIGIFVLALGGFKAYNHFTAANVVVIDDLHQQNLDGRLDPDEGYVYNGYSFVKADGLWWTEIDVGPRLIKIPLHYSPHEVEDIPLTGKLSKEFNNGTSIFMAIDPEVNYNKYYTLALMEMNNNILQGVQRNVQSACTKENPICENRTVVNCERTEGKPVVEVAVAPAPSIELDGSCIKVSGDGEALIKAADRMLYHWYGIMS